MTLLVLAYLGGVLTIASPCILPVLPFVFARADQPFVKSVLPRLVGMAVTFAAVDARRSQGKGRPDRLLDIFLHQLPSRYTLRKSLGGKIQGLRSGRDRRAYAGICLRAQD